MKAPYLFRERAGAITTARDLLEVRQGIVLSKCDAEIVALKEASRVSERRFWGTTAFVTCATVVTLHPCLWTVAILLIGAGVEVHNAFAEKRAMRALMKARAETRAADRALSETYSDAIAECASMVGIALPRTIDREKCS